jgi:hypothetical protein
MRINMNMDQRHGSEEEYERVEAMTYAEARQLE